MKSSTRVARSVATLGVLSMIGFTSASLLPSALAAQTASAGYTTVTSYRAPNGSSFIIVKKNAKTFSYKDSNGKIASQSFASRDAVIQYLRTANPKKAPAPAAKVAPAAPVYTPTAATGTTPAARTPDTTTRAS